MKQVNEVIMPSLGLDLDGQNISEATVCRWLAKLGYELKEVKKGIYVDRHEQEDVVTYRKSFSRQFGDNERYLSIAVELLELSAYKEQVEMYI